MKIETLSQLPQELISQIIHEDEGGAWTASGAENILNFLNTHQEAFTSIGLFEDGLIGALVFRPEDLRIIMIGVIKEKRHHGYGSALIDFLKAKADEMHLARIEANAASNAMGFYQANHFEPVGEPSSAGGLDFTPVEYLLGREWLGKGVTVTVDHPYGSFHPTIADVTYPVNFGYVSAPIAVNEGMQDAWVIGPQEPVDTFTGTVAGIVYHKDGSSRWIVVQPGMTVNHQSVIDLIGFEEQYYETQIIWA